MYKYAIEIFNSEGDDGYIAVVSELPGCSAFGGTEEAALEEVKIAIELWLETAKKKVVDLPQSQGKELPNALYKHFKAVNVSHNTVKFKVASRTEECKSCGFCDLICPHQDACIGCGACVCSMPL